MDMHVFGSLSPKKGKYLDLIKKDWLGGLVTFIDEILSIFLNENENDRIKLKIQATGAMYDEPTMEIYDYIISVYLPIETKIDYSKFSKPCIEIRLWESCFECQNLEIFILKLNRDNIINPNIKNNKIKFFEICLMIQTNFENLISQLENFDTSQIETVNIIVYVHTKETSEILKYLLGRCKVQFTSKQNEKEFRFYHTLLGLCCNFEKVELLDSSLFLVVDSFL